MMTVTAQTPFARAFHALALAALIAGMAVNLLVIPPALQLNERTALASLSPDAIVARALNQLVMTAEGYSLSHPRYTARFSPAGPEMLPASGGPAWSWNLEQVRLGDQNLPGVNLAPVDPVAGSDQIIRYPRGLMIEQYVLRAGTVEQQFMLPQPLGTGGDLEIRGRVNSPGELTRTSDGWAWVDAAGRAVTLGDVFVFDANGATIPALMEVGVSGTRIIVDGAALAQAVYPVTVDPQIGAADFPISTQGPVNDINFTAFTPTIAYNSRDNQYLVAWTGTLGPGEEDIYIQRLDAAGNPLSTAGATPGTGVRVSVSRNDQIYDALSPELAYNPDRNEYLLVFRMDDTQLGLVDNQYEVYGQILAADGTPVAPADPAQIVAPHPFNDTTPGGTGLSNFRISFMNADGTGFGDAVEPSVDYSPATGEYLVAWWGDKETDERFDIRGRFVAGNGALRGPVDMLISSMGPNATNIAYAAYDPAVAYNPVSEEFLVVWSGADEFSRVLSDLGRLESDYEIHGQRITAASRALVGGNFAISAMENQLAPSADPRLNEPSFFFDARTPAVAVGADGRYMVAWQGNTVAVPFTTGSGATDYTPVYEVYGQLLDVSGAEIGLNDFRLSSMGANDTDTRYGLVNGPVYRDGAYTDFVINDGRGGLISFYSIGASVDLAYDSANDEFLVTWASDNDTGDSRVGASEIFVQRVRASDGAEIGRDDYEISSVGESASARFDAHTPGIAYNGAGDEMLVIWSANERDIEFEIYGQRMAFAPPYVVNVNTVNNTGDGTLAQNELTSARINRIDVTLSETVSNPARASSYLLVEAGTDTVYDTVDCAGPAGDDQNVSRTTSYDSATLTTRLSLGGNLPTGRYRLLACSTATSLIDSDADEMDGNRDGTGGDPFVRDFIVDRTAPAFSQPPNLTIDSPSPAGVNVSFDLSEYVSDSIDASPTISCTPVSGSFFNVGTTTVRCTATDDVGNTSNQVSFTVQVIYRTTPVITTPGDIVVEATGPSGAVVTYSASAADTDGPVAVSCAPASGATFPLGDTTVTCQATNELGTSSSQFTVTVRDTTDPTVTVPVDVTIEATSGAGATYSFIATGSDLVGPVTVNCTPASGSVFPLGETEVTCTATDGANNSVGASFTVTVEDTTGPTLTVPANIMVEATGPSGAIVTFTVDANDSVDGDLELGCDWNSGELFPLGTTLVTCVAIDDSENRISASFSVTVRDTTAPTVTAPANITVEATGPGGAVVTFNATASDTVDSSLTVDCTPASGSTFALGTTTVICSATDDNNNTGQASFTVTVRDTTNPTVTVPADATVEANTTGGATYSFSATGSDSVGPVAVNCTPASGSLFPLGDTEVSCTATDGANNSASASFTVTVVDTTAPTVTVPANITVEATGPGGAAVTFSASTTDVADGTPTLVCTPASGSTFALGTTKVNCTATDDSNNSADASFGVIVVDTTPPTLSGLTNITTGTTNDAGAPVSFSVTASDLVDGDVAVSCDANSGDTFPIGMTTVTCSATDSRDNNVEGSFTVTVRDERIPTLSVPANLTVEANRVGGALVNYNVSASDHTGPLTPTCAPATGSFFALGATTVNCSVTGQNGMQTTASFSVTVQDTQAPTLRLPADTVIEAAGPDGARFTFQARASDVADSSVTPVCSRASGDLFPLGVTTVTCSAGDDSGNTATGSFQVTVRDTRAPILTPPANQTFQTDDEAGMTVVYTPPTVRDLVDPNPLVSCTPARGQHFPVGATIVTCTARDAQGNRSSVSFTITVELRATAPQFKLFLPAIFKDASLPLDNTPCRPDGLGCEPR